MVRVSFLLIRELAPTALAGARPEWRRRERATGGNWVHLCSLSSISFCHCLGQRWLAVPLVSSLLSALTWVTLQATTICKKKKKSFGWNSWSRVNGVNRVNEKLIMLGAQTGMQFLLHLMLLFSSFYFFVTIDVNSFKSLENWEGNCKIIQSLEST